MTNVLELLANVVMKRYLLGNMILTIVVSPRMNPVMKIKALATVKVDKKSYLKIFVKCPISWHGYVSIKSNCTSNHDCPVSSFSSRVCNDKINISVDYCSGSVGQYVHGKLCPLANEGLSHQQCYTM